MQDPSYDDLCHAADLERKRRREEPPPTELRPVQLRWDRDSVATVIEYLPEGGRVGVHGAEGEVAVVHRDQIAIDHARRLVECATALEGIEEPARARACVNACANIETDTLTRYGVGGVAKTFEETAKLRDAADELRDAAHELVQLADDLVPAEFSEGARSKLYRIDRAARAVAAFDKARGER